MRSLAENLTGAGVPTLNLLPILREAAAAKLNEGTIIYYPDDAHWNAMGCAIAAHSAAPWLAALLKPGYGASGDLGR
jgi:hypothetical protein